MAEQTETRPVKGREPKGITKEQIAEHNKKMAGFYAAIKANRGFKDKYFSTPESLVEAIDGYIACVMTNGLFPTETGLMLYLDCTDSWYYAVQAMDDERSAVLKKYRQYVGEFLNQSGLAGGSNTIFSIYYLKSKMQQWDQPTEQTINLNIGSQRAISPGDLLQLAQGTPVEADFTEVE